MGSPLDIIVPANNTLTVNINVLQLDGELFDMSGYSAFWQVKSPQSIVPLISKSTADSTILIVNNVLSFTILPADTVGLQHGDYGDYIHEAIVLDNAGNPFTIFNDDARITWGKFTVRKQITVPT